jgi:uncharacterized protein with FMN-binding domain
MTRRILLVVLAIALTAVAFTGCAKKTVYQDGIYTAYSAADSRGSIGQVTLTIAADKFTDVAYVEFTPKSDNNYPYKESVAAVAAIQAQLIATGDIDKVDAVTNATGTSEQLKTAVKNALATAGTPGSYTDGTYVGFSDADSRGSVGYASVTVTGGAISDAKLYSLQKKTTDSYPYATSINAWAVLEAKLVETQDLANVDAVSQATATTGRFKDAVTKALEKAKN